jgi:glycosyltransferase involved in cell wall biosynthesis
MPAWPEKEAAEVQISGSPVIGCFGFINPARRIPQLLQAFVRVRSELPEAVLIFAGGASGLDLQQEAERAGVDVVIRGYVDEDELWGLLAACDVSVSLRWPTMGETSAIVIRALSAGKPLVVSDVGWFAELPDAAALKVPVGDGEVEALADALMRAAGNEQMAAAARDLARTEHDLEHVAELYAAACEEAAGLSAVEDGVLRGVAVAAADVGLAPDSPAVRDLAAAAREVTRGE